MIDTTVVYYTSNTEKPAFAEKTRQALLEAKGDLPLISVSQKPIDFGTNICVGEVGVSNENVYRQLLRGVMAAETRFVCTAEEDCLYTPEYFAHQPPDDVTFSLAHPFWVLFAQKGKAKIFARKPHSVRSFYIDVPFVVGRQTLIDRLRVMLPLLSTNRRRGPYVLDKKLVKVEIFEASSVTFKTDENMHRRTPCREETKTRNAPVWGNAQKLLEEYYG